jgi:hypothetical protein
MSVVDQAVENQLKNIEKRTGKTLAELTVIIRESGLSRHGEIRQMVIDRFGLGYGDANSLVHYVQKSSAVHDVAARGLSSGDVVNELYAGPKSELRPIHDRLMTAIQAFGEFEISPKKTYLSLRRKRQFAMIGPATKTRVEVGLNMKGIEPTGRLILLPPGGMCNYKVNLTSPDQVDEELIAWLRIAFDSAI